ncbi:hypothetical protein N9E26_01125 [bacterium]|nr:hypothetical protein [bacterium]
MLETAKLILVCSLFFDGEPTFEGNSSPSNTDAYLDKITIYDTGWFDNNPDQGKVEIISYKTEQLVPQKNWFVDFEAETTYTVSEGGNYYFETAYDKTEEDEDTLEITRNQGRIELAIDPVTLKYKSAFFTIEDGVEEGKPVIDYGYCIPINEKLD